MNATHGAARVFNKTAGKVSMHPRLVIESVSYPTDEDFRNKPAYFAVLPVEELLLSSVAPVERTAESGPVKQTVQEGWSRVMAFPERLINPFFPPMLISARDRWHWSGKELEIFDDGIILDGAHRLASAATFGKPMLIPIVVVFGLSDEEERAVRQGISRESTEEASLDPLPRVDTSTPRLEIKDRWVLVEVESDPFIIPTGLGYAPGILARRRGAQQRQHILIGARSLALPLEEIRTARGSLIGVHIKVRKQSLARSAPYEILVDEDGNDS